MIRRVVFGLVFTVSFVLLAVLTLWYVGSYQGGSGSMAGMMNQMAGGQAFGGMPLSMPWSVWISVVVLVLVLSVGAAGMAYYMAVPEIRLGASLEGPRLVTDPVNARSPEDFAVLVRTAKPDERKVLEVLAAHNGRYLQKFIAKESGLSRLKTHRIVSRFAERGVVTATKSGNTNEIALAAWLVRRTASPGN